LIGFIDLLPDAFPNAPIIEIKFSEKKWNSRKAQYKWMQAAIYAWAMEHDFVQFHVMNYEKPGLQTFDMNISEIETDRMLDNVVKAIEKIESGIRKPEENKLCGWCDFQEHCPLFNTNIKDVN
jgi:CRISPR/Cas system-associated exonuclease Cas4 (RecB family)